MDDYYPFILISRQLQNESNEKKNNEEHNFICAQAIYFKKL